MIPPFSIFEVWTCMFDAMKLANLHAERVDDYLPDAKDPDLIDFEEMRARRRAQFPPVLTDSADTADTQDGQSSEYQKAS